MAEHADTLDFFGRLENRLALVATMTEAQGQRLDRLSPVEPVAGELCNEISALRTDVAAAVDELRKLARHVAAVEAVTLPAAVLAQQMAADRRKVPGIGAVDSRHAGRWDQPGQPVASGDLLGYRAGQVSRAELDAQRAAAPAADLSALPGLRDMAEDLAAHLQTINGASDLDAMQAAELAHGLRQLVDGRPAANVVADRRATPVPVAVFRPELEQQRMEVARQLLELRRQGRLVDARALVDPGLATFGLLDLVEQLANGLANVANAPALAQLADVIRRQIRTLADTDARAAQTPVFMVLGPAYPQSDKALEGIKE